jgi:5-methyltetrahydropteroyltriglutamate--homocysteine methyltransferase
VPPELVAGLIRKALEYVPPERLVITLDWGFGGEDLSRRIAHYKWVSLVENTNIIRRELGRYRRQGPPSGDATGPGRPHR